MYADADDSGLRFILPSWSRDEAEGGLYRPTGSSHFGTIVGRGGAGKSILALQLLTALLRKRTEQEPPSTPERPHAAFYFTLEATPSELAHQVEQFTWGQGYKAVGWEPKSLSAPAQRADAPDRFLRVSEGDKYSRGLYIVSVPSPVEGLSALSLQIRQTIARQLHLIGRIVAIVVDPMGAINLAGDLTTDLTELRDLSRSHRTFLFVLTEEHVFARHTSIEHFSQSIIHLQHDPSNKQHRRLFVQKARGQSFRSGFHQFELHHGRGDGHNEPISLGIRVYPSLEAQSAYAHERLASRTDSDRPEPKPLLSGETEATVFKEEKIVAGSAVFLMGPPGTFKEQIAARFAAPEEGVASIYLSFKADREAIASASGDTVSVTEFGSESQIEDADFGPHLYFFDARNPLLTPEEILFGVRNAIQNRTRSLHSTPPVVFERAVVWGLRRLHDLPNFRDGKSVQFLEALVTLLKSHWITSLLVDWPDAETRNTLPVVDLCQYILLTRVCSSPSRSTQHGRRRSDRDNETRETERSAADYHDLWRLWGVDRQNITGGNIEDWVPSVEELKTKHRQVAFLRAQRSRLGFRRDEGVVMHTTGKALVLHSIDSSRFEHIWRNHGEAWEEDPSLVN